MSQRDRTKLLLKSSEERRRKHVEKTLKNPKVKAALQRDQRPKQTPGDKSRRAVA